MATGKLPVSPLLSVGKPAPVAVTSLPRTLVLGSKMRVRDGIVSVAVAVTPASSVTDTVTVPADRVATVTGTTALATKFPLESKSNG